MFESLRPGAPAFLASVTGAGEALLAHAAGADIIDCKEPSRGALGTLDPADIRAIVTAIAGRAGVSATVGDLPADPDVLSAAAQAMAALGVDAVKIGFFGDGDARGSIAALGRLDLGRVRRIAVLMADRAPDLALLPALAAAGFAGVMLDTAGKATGALPDILDAQTLANFVAAARRHGLVSGLAGSLRRAHIAQIVALQPAIIGFRGALCRSGRTGVLDAELVKAVRDDIDTAIRATVPIEGGTLEASPLERSVA